MLFGVEIYLLFVRDIFNLEINKIMRIISVSGIGGYNRKKNKLLGLNRFGKNILVL